MDGYPLDCYDYQSTCGAKNSKMPPEAPQAPMNYNHWDFQKKVCVCCDAPKKIQLSKESIDTVLFFSKENLSNVHRSKASPSIGCFCRVSNVCICIYNHNCISISLYLSYVSAVQRAQVHSFSINWMFLPRFFSSQQMLTSQPSFTKGGGATFLSFFFF